MNKHQEALDRLNTINMVNFMGDKELIKHKDNDIKTLQELVDKETPMKVEEELELFRCPNCNEKLLIYKRSINYCYECGQKLDWSEE